MHALAIYDMDKTITRDATWTAFLIHTARAQAPWRLVLLPAAVVAAAAYAARLIDRAELKQATQRILLGSSLSPDAVAAAARDFADRIVATGVFEGAIARIAADRLAGFRPVLATASYRFYAAEIGKRLGFEDVIATESEYAAVGHLLPRIAGENCYGPAKLRMIEAWMAGQGIARTDANVRFYSDHVSDAPALEWADEAFAVNPHAPLRKLAAERGWTILDFES